MPNLNKQIFEKLIHGIFVIPRSFIMRRNGFEKGSIWKLLTLVISSTKQ